MGLNVNNVNMVNSPSVYQAYDNNASQWDWVVGNQAGYWGFSIRCDDRETRLEILEQWTTYDGPTEHFVVSTISILGPLPRNIPHRLGASLTFHAVQVD
jgi:hypothetical protein